MQLNKFFVFYEELLFSYNFQNTFSMENNRTFVIKISSIEQVNGI